MFTLTIFFSKDDRSELKLPEYWLAQQAIAVVEKAGWNYILVNNEGVVVQYAM